MGIFIFQKKAHHYSHLELVPVLVAAPERSLDPDLGRVVLVLLLVVDLLVKGVPQLPGPGTHGLDVHLQEVLVWGGGECEAVELLGLDRSACEPDPLTRKYLQGIKLKTYLSF